MLFSGKKYKRTRYENLEELLNLTNPLGDSMQFFHNNAPIFCFTKIGENEFNYVLEAAGRHISFNFTLGEEKEVERRDGTKIKIIFTMPSENVLIQVIKIRDGKVVTFTREFNDNEAKMIVTMDDWQDKQATIYFESVE